MESINVVTGRYRTMTNVAIRGFEMADWEDVAEIFLALKCQ
ncbi:hypothetical protein [Brunnivagina elsteri]|nr:hypothetical protein [Calothrix elsteri]